eukprot:1869811-Pleurochrysis_carterae.AAC.2
MAAALRCALRPVACVGQTACPHRHVWVGGDELAVARTCDAKRSVKRLSWCLALADLNARHEEMQFMAGYLDALACAKCRATRW